MGLETEYGIAVEGREVRDQVEEAAELVRSFPGPCVPSWDYRFEDPRRDARGFRAEQLRTDPVDSQFDRPGTLPAEALRCDRVLANGARLYNDHGHPEYSTPECLSLADLVAHDRAGERLLLQCAEAYSERTGRRVRLYKNNTDFQGASYGTHENYLGLRSVPFERYAEALLAFLPTRIVYTGSGRAGSDRQREPAFRLSQRAEFFAEPIGIDTLYRRPIVNTRDEPHADPNRWRRIHVIAGDANMQPFATALKVGATSLVLELVEEGWECPMRLADPVRAMERISRDETYRWNVELAEGSIVGAVAVQREFLSAAAERFGGRDAQTDWVLGEWERTLGMLEEDPLLLADRLDWPAKLALLRTFMEAEGVEWGSDRVVAADLEYHNLDPEEGLFWVLDTEQMVSEERVAEAAQRPPVDTRAALRGRCVRRFGEAVREVSWSGMTLDDGAQSKRLDLSRMVGEVPRELVDAVEGAESLEEFLRIASGSAK
ncbi:MAG: proteasome accessory factor PafA2 [Fimbriimonadales bacterium]